MNIFEFGVRRGERPGILSLAIALGAFLVALVANIHDLGSPSGYRPIMLIALVVWPTWDRSAGVHRRAGACRCYWQNATRLGVQRVRTHLDAVIECTSNGSIVFWPGRIFYAERCGTCPGHF